MPPTISPARVVLWTLFCLPYPTRNHVSNQIVTQSLGLFPQESGFGRVKPLILKLDKLLAITGHKCRLTVVDQLLSPCRRHLDNKELESASRPAGWRRRV